MLELDLYSNREDEEEEEENEDAPLALDDEEEEADDLEPDALIDPLVPAPIPEITEEDEEGPLFEDVEDDDEEHDSFDDVDEL